MTNARYTVIRTNDPLGGEFMGHDGPKPVIALATDDLAAAWREVHVHGGDIIDHQDRVLLGRGSDAPVSEADMGWDFDAFARPAD